jgi:hypothetical protein
MADRLEEAATLLEAQGADRFRVRAFRDGAAAVRALPEPPESILARDGLKGLIRLPKIGAGIAGAVAEMVGTGRWRRLERLRGESEPEAEFRTLPGVGPATARAIHEDLHLDTLEALEIAAHDGRLERLPGIGPRKAAAIRAGLAEAFARRRPGRPGGTADEPPIALMLKADARYRHLASEGRLRRIAPRRFNPEKRAWLPIMHWDADGWSFTALFSNTERAHRLGRTDDWVVLFFEKDGGGVEGQRTVVTETRGPMAGRRVVRGLEADDALLGLDGRQRRPRHGRLISRREEER